MAFVGLSFPGTGCPVPDVANIHLILNVYGLLFLQLSTSIVCFRIRTFFLKNR